MCNINRLVIQQNLMAYQKVLRLFSPVIFLALTACSHAQYGKEANDNTISESTRTYSQINNSYFDQIALAPSKAKKDRAAILALQGEYRVTFDFFETVILANKYERFPPKETSGFETVIVIENTAERIALQHILVAGGGHIIKHWRQDWYFEATERFEFTEYQTWEIKEIALNKRKGFWTQCVYEVSDAPRYCGTGQWNHRYGVSTWTSDRSWRPLPRREYTARDDYNALNVENRHTVTPRGWTHEQDNTKVIRRGETMDQTIVREFGFNDYQKIDGYDFSPAYDYWQKTEAYWSRVRSFWSTNFQRDGYVILDTPVDGMAVINATFEQATATIESGVIPDTEDIWSLLKQWVNTTAQANSP